MPIHKTDFPGLMIIEPIVLEDARGYFFESYNQKIFETAGLNYNWVQDNQSRSTYGVVRGLHYQLNPHAQAKLVRVVAGTILDVAVDIRKGSSTYGKHVAMELNDSDGRQLYVPVGFAHGFCTLVPDTEVIYKVTDFWTPDCESGVLWNDPALEIAWPDFAGAQIAVKDAALLPLSTLDSPFTSGSE